MNESAKNSIVDGSGLELLSAQRLGQESGLGKRRIYRLHATEGLPGVRLGGRLWFRAADYQAWLASRTEVARGEKS